MADELKPQQEETADQREARDFAAVLRWLRGNWKILALAAAFISGPEAKAKIWEMVSGQLPMASARVADTQPDSSLESRVASLEEARRRTDNVLSRFALALGRLEGALSRIPGGNNLSMSGPGDSGKAVNEMRVSGLLGLRELTKTAAPASDEALQ